MIYEGETGTEDDHGDGGAAETLAARDAGSSAAAFFRALSTPWISLAFFCESGERCARRQSSSVARGRRARDGRERRASTARTRALRWRVCDVFANACVFQMIPPARGRLARDARDASVDGSRSALARRGARVGRRRSRAIESRSNPARARARRTSRERALLHRHERERGEHGVDERVDARAGVARDVARDGAGRRATVRDGVRGRQRALVQSSRGRKETCRTKRSNVRLSIAAFSLRVFESAPCRDRRGAEAYGFFPTQSNNDFYSRPSPRISADSRVNSAIRTRPFSAMKAATRSISSRET